MKDRVVLLEQGLGFRPERIGLAAPQAVGLPGIEPLPVSAGADERDHRRQPRPLRGHRQPGYASRGTAQPAYLLRMHITTADEILQYRLGIRDSALGTQDIAVGEPLVKVEPLRTARRVGIRWMRRAERDQHVA